MLEPSPPGANGLRLNARHREQERKKKEEEKQKMLKNAWEYKYHQFFEKLGPSKERFEENMRLNNGIFNLMGRFREQSVRSVKELVHDLIFPDYARDKQQFQELTEDQLVFYQFRQKNERIFFDEFIIYRMTFIQSDENRQYLAPDDRVQKGASFLEPRESSLDTHAQKMLQHEFNAFDVLNDIVLVCKQESNQQMKVPLCCLVKYLGFTVLCIAKPPIAEVHSLVQGPDKQGNYIEVAYLKPLLEEIAYYLNLKPFEFKLTNGRKQEIQLSIFTEIHISKSNLFEDIQKQTETEEEKEARERMKKQKIEKLQPDQYYYYIFKPGTIFPLDSNIKDPAFQHSSAKR